MNTNISIESPIPPHCPWSEMYQNWGPPNVKWCEARVCGWIGEPFNTWSNLPYMLLAIYVLYIAYRHRSRFDFAFGSTVFIMGAFSFFYHASNNFLTQVFDFAGMYLYTYLLLCISLYKLKFVSYRNSILLYTGLVLGSIFMVPVFKNNGWPYQLIILFISMAIITCQVFIYLQRKVIYRIQYLLATVAGFMVAGFFSSIDASRLWCNPENHFAQGHALWHIFGSISIYYSYKLFRGQVVN